ncbi:MAG: ArsR family transcriptional regulator, partial [Crenarchaeota archaeon]|nr:ArsR family transcriptional regulator [Thermoproteota archaeon]
MQRELNLSSHSVARYHLSKLENEGLVRRKNGKYAVS